MNESRSLPPHRRATLKDVASAAGVHVSTVSRALNERTSHLITEEVRSRIKAVCDDLDYLPNQTAYSLRTRRSHTIGVVIPDITNLVFPPIIRGIEDGLSDHGYVAIMVNTDADLERESRMIDTLIARGVDGLIMANVSRRDVRISELTARSIEIVTVNRRVDDPAVPSVVNDEEEGVRRVLEHLAGLGHRRIAHLAGPQEASTGRRRYRAFKAAARALGLAAGPDLIAHATAFNEREGERCARELLAAGTDVTALLCANDRIAIGAIGALRERGLDCPRDMSVTGFNDMPFADRVDPALTTVRVEQYQAGRQAAAILVERLAAPGTVAPRHDVLPVAFIARASSGPPPQRA